MVCWWRSGCPWCLVYIELPSWSAQHCPHLHHAHFLLWLTPPSHYTQNHISTEFLSNISSACISADVILCFEGIVYRCDGKAIMKIHKHRYHNADFVIHEGPQWMTEWMKCRHIRYHAFSLYLETINVSEWKLFDLFRLIHNELILLCESFLWVSKCRYSWNVVCFNREVIFMPCGSKVCTVQQTTMSAEQTLIKPCCKLWSDSVLQFPQG